MAMATLVEIEDGLRAAAGHGYLVGTANGLVGFSAWRKAPDKAGMTVDANRLALAAR
ncbi:hypothetical protein [Bradyrhizobium sp. 6(2017)]|uniref:hypothetical protein n=1 Tax=Bradyrhizobium sp. 6(2017) TaxID=1197460 RepID=UPI0013E13079|nr:hypothetical protein [Bradyrhizobium sp. 6(2017)]QIG93497.1 hypothetical protein G6P99_13935 [Bradyrhizobium sp. 6(2017)]